MVGILWFDDSSRSLKDKVEPAVRRYTEKFGRPPTVCYVHPSALNGSAITLDVGGFPLRVEARRSVLRDHFFVVGEEDEGYHGFAAIPGPAPDAGRDLLGPADSGNRWVQSSLQALEEVPGGGQAPTGSVATASQLCF